MLRTWYLIPEIQIERYVKGLKPMYDVLEGKNNSKCETDSCLKAILMNHKEMTEDAFMEMEKGRLAQKNREMKMGEFHEYLAGCFPGWECIPKGKFTSGIGESTAGKKTGLDVVKQDRTEIMEWKNKHNTVKGSDLKKTVFEKLMKCHVDGMKVHFVQVHCKGGKVDRHGAPPEINVMDGKMAYEYLSGRATFFNDLNATLAYTFKTFKTYASLLKQIS